MAESKNTESKLTTDKTQHAADAVKLSKREKLAIRNETHLRIWSTALSGMPLSLGEAYSQNACFFDAIVQALPTDKLQECKSNDPLFHEKWLRTVCSEEANKIHQVDTQNNWIKKWDTWLTSDVPYEKYLSHIQYAAHEVNNSSVKATDILRGDPDIDGRLLCAHFNVKLHVMGWDESTNQIVHKIVSNDHDNPIDSVEPHEIDYNDPNLIHIAHYKDHFVPLVMKGDKTIQHTKNCEIPKQDDTTSYNRDSKEYTFSPKLDKISAMPEITMPKEKKILVPDGYAVVNGKIVPNPFSSSYSLAVDQSPHLSENKLQSASSIAGKKLEDELKKPDNEIPSRESTETFDLLKVHLEELTTALKEEKPNKETLETAFTVLYQHCTSLSVLQWGQFLPLVHDYIQQCLPERNILYTHYQHKTEPKTLAETRHLLEQYKQIAQHARHYTDYSVWRKFYHQAYVCLTQKGYYKSEAWLGEVQTLPEEDKPFDEAKAQKSCQNNATLKDYYDELVRQLSGCMEAAIVINSGRIDPAKGIGQSVATAALGELIPYMLGTIPIAGSTVSNIALLGQKAFEFACKLREQRSAGHVCAWLPTSTDKDQLVKAIGLRLTLLRESKLLSAITTELPPPSDAKTGIVDTLKEKKHQATTWYRGIQENKIFNSAEALALKDCDTVLNLLQQNTPNKKLWGGSAEWLKTNADFIAAQFSKNQQLAKEPASATLLQPITRSTDAVLPAPIFYQLGTDVESDWSKRKQLSDTQALSDGRIECQAGWKNLWKSIDKTKLDALISFQNTVLQELTTPFLAWSESERQAIIEQYIRPLWSEEVGLKAITQAVKTASQQSWADWKLIHQSVQTALDNLNAHNTKLAQSIRSRYRRSLGEWQLQVKQKRDQQIAELKQLAVEAKVFETRYNSWMEGFKEKAEDLGFDFEITLSKFEPITGKYKDSYINPELFRQQALEAWRKGEDFEEFDPKSLQWESAWKGVRNQDRLEATRMHLALAHSFQQARQEIMMAAEASLLTRNARRKELEQQIQDETTAKALKDVLETLIAEQKNTKHASISIPKPSTKSAKEEKKSASQSQPFGERIVEFWQRATEEAQELEQQYLPPCGFSLIAWPIDCPHLMNQWYWGLLLTDSTQKNNPYWQWYARLLNGRLATLTQSMSLPMQWTMASDNYYSALIDSESLTPYRHKGHCFAVSHTQGEQAKNLWTTYQQQTETRLASLVQLQEQKITSGRILAQANMKVTLAVLPVAFKKSEMGHTICNPTDTVLRPLLLWLRDASSFYGLAPDTPENLLIQLQTQGHLHADFVADLRAAYTWGSTNTEALHDAWLHEQPPINFNLEPGQALLRDKKETTPIGANAFYLSKSLYQRHRHYTLNVLKQTWDDTYGCWNSNEKISQAFDPLAIYARSLLEQAAQPELTDRQAFKLLRKLIRTILHRPSLQQATWHVELFPKLPEARQLYYLKKLTPHFSYEEQASPEGLIHRLNHTPTPSGRRARWIQEQVEWRDHLLPKLWIENKSTTSEVKKSAVNPEKTPFLSQSEPDSAPSQSSTLEEKSPTAPEAKTTPPIEISVVRQKKSHGKLVWETQTHTLKPKVAEKLFDSQGQWRPKDEKVSGRHKVFPVEIDNQHFWIKAYPELPAMEWIVHQLDRRLGIFGTPRFEVVKFHHGNQTSCALVSEHIIGSTLRSVIKNEPEMLEKLEFVSFARTLLRVLLINPEDDKDDDYILETQPNGQLHLKRIDNERAFFEPLVEEDGSFLFKKTTLQVKSIVYCLEQMRQNWPRESGIQVLLKEWQKIDFIALLQDLFEQATQTHTAWCKLFSLEEIRHHFQLPDPDKGLILMCIPSELTTEIIDRITILKKSLKLATKPKILAETKKSTPYSLSGLTLLHDTQPKLGEYYGRAHSASLTLQEHKTDDAIEIPRQHDRGYKRFKEYVGSHYQKNVREEYKTKIGASQAFQKTLRLEIPLTLEDLKAIWHSEKSSPKQALDQLNELQKKHLENLAEKILTPKAKFLDESKKFPQNKEIKTAEAEEQLWQGYQENLAKKFHGLALHQRIKIWTDFHKQLGANQLSLQQQSVILDAMTGTGWPELDLSVFSPELITNERVTLLLKGTLEAKPPVGLTMLNISGCDHLTEDVLKVIQVHNHESLKYLYCNHQPWKNITIRGLDELLHFECKESKQLMQLTLDLNETSKLSSIDLTNSSIQIISGTAPQLTTLRLNNCEQLQHIGERGYLFNRRPFSTPQLQQLNITQCINLEGLCLSSSLFYNVFIPHLTSFQKLQSIELQTGSDEWIRADFLLPPLKTRSSILDYSDDDRLAPEQIKALAAYLPHDLYFTYLDLSNAQLDDESITLLAHGLIQNKTITHLDLSGNKITVRGAKTLGKMLQSNTSLVSLDLWGDDIGWEGADAIAEAMQTNTTLQEFRHHYVHYKLESWNKNTKTRWLEEGDYIKRTRESKRLSFSTFFALNRSSPLANEEKQSRTSTSSSMSIAPTAPISIADVKSSASPLDEKTKQKFLKLQDKLVTACEKGNLAAVKKAISQGAQANQPNALGKQPLYAAVYGMNPKIVQYVIARRAEEAPTISWRACKEHNKKHYGQTFLNMKFEPLNFISWYDLLRKIESNEFLAGYHMAQCIGSNELGEINDYRSVMKQIENANMVIKNLWLDDVLDLDYILSLGNEYDPSERYDRRQVVAFRQSGAARWCYATEAGYEVRRNQIKQVIEALQEAQTMHTSVSYYTTTL